MPYVMALSAITRPVTGAYAIAVVDAIMLALDVVHGVGVVHGDVKPENIFLGPSGEIHLGKQRYLPFHQH